VAYEEEKKNACRVLEGKPERKKPPGRPGIRDVDWRIILK
jgi:hypothetical protein